MHGGESHCDPLFVGMGRNSSGIARLETTPHNDSHQAKTQQNHVGAFHRRKATEFRHVGHREWPPDGLTQILPEFLEFSPRHGFLIRVDM